MKKAAPIARGGCRLRARCDAETPPITNAMATIDRPNAMAMPRLPRTLPAMAALPQPKNVRTNVPNASAMYFLLCRGIAYWKSVSTRSTVPMEPSSARYASDLAPLSVTSWMGIVTGVFSMSGMLLTV